jgi:DNA-binding NarL/FixJ family response regulator
MSGTTSDPIRVLIVDDHTLFRESLSRLLNSEPEFRVCGDVASAEEALIALQQGLLFDVGLIDYDLGVNRGKSANGLEFLEQIRQIQPDARILIVTAGMEPAALSRTIQGLNAGIFLKSEPTVELLLAIRRTAQGEQWVSSRAALALLASRTPHPESIPKHPDEMSPRERRVLQGVLEGKSNKQIGAQLDLTESLVKSVLQSIFEKTGVRSRSQLVRYAIETQLEPRSS